MYMDAHHSSTPSYLPPSRGGGGGEGQRGEPARSPPLPFLLRAAVRMSRARWYGFLRRVFHYQNGMRSDSARNPFNSAPWLALEFASLLVQIASVTVAMAISHREKPVWPLRVWVAGYNLGSLLSLPVLYWRYRHSRAAAAHVVADAEEARRGEETSCSQLTNRSRTLLELFFAMWFVMGNVWVFDSRHASFDRAPVLHTLCVALLAWNAVGYSFPFVLFVLLCCCVPLVRSAVGYNMNIGSEDRGASDDEIARLPRWRFEAAGPQADVADQDWECCICLAKYNDKEEVRQLPCSHLFHLRCVDQWLKIIACCPLCKQELER